VVTTEEQTCDVVVLGPGSTTAVVEPEQLRLLERYRG
jgi:hypothetical protein